VDLGVVRGNKVFDDRQRGFVDSRDIVAASSRELEHPLALASRLYLPYLPWLVVAWQPHNLLPRGQDCQTPNSTLTCISSKEQRMEKVIHAQESASDGFLHEFERNYAASKGNRTKSTIVLCWVDSNTAVVVDVHGNRTFSTDTSQLQTSQRLHVRQISSLRYTPVCYICYLSSPLVLEEYHRHLSFRRASPRF
jgi:hypothetical protein